MICLYTYIQSQTIDGNLSTSISGTRKNTNLWKY